MMNLNYFDPGLKKYYWIAALAAMGLVITSCTHFKDIFSKNNVPYQQTNTKRSRLGQVLPDLSLFPMNDTRFRLSELKNIKAIVITMRDISCPVSQKYGPLIAHIEQEYAPKGIQFIYSYVGQKKPEKNAKKDLKKFKFKGPYVIDTRQKIINTLGADTTGEVFILTPERKLIYKGPLDNSEYLLSSKSDDYKAKKHYVTDVLQAVTSGKEITPQVLEAPGKLISRPLLKKQVYFKDVMPVIQEKCTSCHNPEGTGLMNFISYEDIAGRGAMFRYVIERDLMPPWYVDPNTGPFRDDISLTLKEKALLLRWVDQGFPVRERKTLLWSKPKKVKSLKGKPDYVISLPEKVVVPAEGPPFYKRFVIQTSFKEDKWIKSVNFILKPKVTHHLVIYIMDASYKYKTENFDHNEKALNFLGSGSVTSKPSRIQNFNEQYNNAGVKLPRFSKIILEFHYETVGQRVIDNDSQIHINFYKKPPKYQLLYYGTSPDGINIPPYQSNYKLEDSYKIQETVPIIIIVPHMHLRGKANSIFVIDPKGGKKRIFGLDPFILTLERSYILKKPLVVHKGSVIKCINWLDNSADNPMNPAPEKSVTQGPFLTDEMSNCFFIFLVPVNTALTPSSIMKRL